MNRYFSVAAAAIAVVVLAAVGFALYSGRPSAPGTSPSPAATPAPTAEATGSPPASPVASTAFPALAHRLSRSDFHGISVSYPFGWELRPASKTWESGDLLQSSPFADVMAAGTEDEVFIAVASQPLTSSMGAWQANFLSGRPCPDREARDIAGLPGTVVRCQTGSQHEQMALVEQGERAHVIWLYGSDDTALFDQILASVDLWAQMALWSSGDFGVPFTYRIPEGPHWGLGGVGPTWFETRVGEWAEALHPGGLIIQAVGGGRADPCDLQSEEITFAAGPQSVFDYLDGIPGVNLSNVVDDLQIDGQPAISAIAVGPTTPPCDPMSVWLEDTEPYSAVPPEIPRRLVMVDVGGEHLVVTIYGEADNPDLNRLADELLGSIRFTETQ